MRHQAKWARPSLGSLSTRLMIDSTDAGSLSDCFYDVPELQKCAAAAVGFLEAHGAARAGGAAVHVRSIAYSGHAGLVSFGLIGEPRTFVWTFQCLVWPYRLAVLTVCPKRHHEPEP